MSGFLIVLIIVALPQISTDLFTPSLPAMTRELATTPGMVQLTISLYLLSIGLLQIVYGSLSDSLGRKPLLIVGLLIYTIGSLATTFAPDIAVLITGRILQGIGVTSISVMYKAILSDNYKDQQLVHYSILASTVWGISPIIAPAIGGYIQHYLGWRYNFGVMLLYGAIIFCIILFFYKESLKQKQPLHVGTIVTNFVTLVQSRVVISSIFLMVASFLCVFTFNIIGPFIIQDVLHYNAVEFGYMSLIVGCFYFLGSFVNKKLTQMYNLLSINFVVTLIMLIDTVAFLISYFFGVQNAIQIVACTAILFACFPIIYVNGMTAAMSKFSHMGGTLSATLGFIAFTATGIIGTIETTIHPHSVLPLAAIYLGLALLALLGSRLQVSS